MRVGIVGTGYAAKLRAETIQTESRAQLVAVAGHDLVRTQTFCQPYDAIACDSWELLLTQFDLDLVIVSTMNGVHGAIVQAALKAGKHVVVEYPLCLDVAEAEALLELAKAQNKLLHVEHIELLGGVHQALKESLPLVGEPFYARYSTLKPERPAPQRWTYRADVFGFPLMGALSRLHRFIDVFGEVERVTCNAQFRQAGLEDRKTLSYLATDDYTTCLCTAVLRFKNGVMAEVTYGKGEALWQAGRVLEVHGERGALIFAGETGTWVTQEGAQPLTIGNRRGLFAKDTAIVLDHLLTGVSLYVTATESVYTLKVAAAAQQSAEQGGTAMTVT